MTIGKKNSTLKKQKGVQETKLVTTGIKNLVFWHEASEGELSIPYSSLVFPSSLVGEVNPTSTEILAANLGLFKNNVKVFSSLNGELMTGLTCLVKSSQILFLNGYEAAEGEIFKVEFKNQAITGNNVVDARPLTATGVLLTGETDFNVGEGFQVGKYSQHQIGEVLVYVDGELQHRNTANAVASPSADGNYQEVAATNGYGSIIRFNESYIEDKPVQVISRNLIAERPDFSMMQLIETLGGQIDKLIEYVSQDIGVDPLIFQTGPNEIDLKAFGDLVYQNKIDIAANTVLIDTKQDKFQIDYQIKYLNSDITVNTADVTDLGFNNLEIGKKYRITGSVSWEADNQDNPTLRVLNNGNVIGISTIGLVQTGQVYKVGINSEVFTATSTSIIAEVTGMDAGNLLAGDGTSNQTWFQLEELPNHVETGKWS